MEGYFRAKEYAKLEGIDYYTAMKRVERKLVQYFKEPNTGFIYIYWTDGSSQLIPEGYICINSFAKDHKTYRSNVLRWINQSRINSNDIFKRIVGFHTEIYINKNAHVDLRYPTALAEINKPNGYLTLREWYEKNDVTKNNAHQMILNHRINFIRHAKHIYVPEDEPIPENKVKGFRYALYANQPEGYLPITDWCKKYDQKYYPMYYLCRMERIPFKKIKNFIYIRDVNKEVLLYDHKKGINECCG